MNNQTTTGTVSNGTPSTGASESSTEEQLKGTAASVRAKITEGTASVRSRVNEGIDSATNRIGEVVEGRANSIASKTQDLLTSVAHSGQYLQHTEPKALGADLVAVIKRHPLLTLAVGAGFGMMMGRIFRR